MDAHVRVLGVLGIVRAALGAALGIWLIVVTIDLRPALYGMPEPSVETVRLDVQAFRLIAGVALALAPLRCAQGLLALLRRPAARPLGKVLATIDLANLIAFPLSTALGLYGMVVYRHPGAGEYLGCHRRAEAEAAT